MKRAHTAKRDWVCACVVIGALAALVAWTRAAGPLSWIAHVMFVVAVIACGNVLLSDRRSVSVYRRRGMRTQDPAV